MNEQVLIIVEATTYSIILGVCIALIVKEVLKHF